LTSCTRVLSPNNWASRLLAATCFIGPDAQSNDLQCGRLSRKLADFSGSGAIETIAL
jgi:hypothetical protein